jgi:hypothetical protein
LAHSFPGAYGTQALMALSLALTCHIYVEQRLQLRAGGNTPRRERVQLRKVVQLVLNTMMDRWLRGFAWFTPVLSAWLPLARGTIKC